jgi:hypothetical protein
LREKNKCSTCERRSDIHHIGCQVFSEEPETCWAHTTDKDWLRKVEKAVRQYILRTGG